MAQLRYPDRNTYFLINQSRVGVSRLADQEALDLDLDPFMSFCDHTSSAPGCQFLYDSLRTPDSDGGIPARHEHLIDTLSENNSCRKNLQTTLQKLDSHDAFSIATLFDSDFPVVSGLKRTLLYIASLIPFTTALLLLLSQSGIWLLILCASLILNLGLHYWNKIKMQSYFVAIPQLAVLFKCADLLSRDAMFKDVNPDIRSLLATCAPLRKKLRYFNFSVRVENEMSGFFFFFSELINYFTLNEVRQVNSAFEELKSKNKDIEQIYRFVATLDMLDSVATMRAKSPFWCHPRFEDQLSLRSVYHPLIDGCVANDLRLDHRSMLLTGSNMAGKSTFIRTVGINLLASKTLNTCFADRKSTGLNPSHIPKFLMPFSA